MSSGSSKRHRSALALPPGQLARTLEYLRRNDVLARIGLCVLAAVLMWICTLGWAPPFAYRQDDIPPRDIVARTEFREEDPVATEQLREQRKQETICVYEHDVNKLPNLQTELKDHVTQVAGAPSYEKADKSIWAMFLAKTDKPLEPAKSEAEFLGFREALATETKLEDFDKMLKRAFADFEINGLLNDDDLPAIGNKLTINVHPVGNPKLIKTVEVKDVRISIAAETIRKRLLKEFQSSMASSDYAETVTRHVVNWLNNGKLVSTLTIDKVATDEAYKREMESVDMVMKTYKRGQKLVDGGRMLTVADINLLNREYRQLTANMKFGDWLGHFLADFGMYTALYVLCGFFVYYRMPKLLTDMRRLTTLLGVVVVTVAISRFVSIGWRAELVPLVVFGMMATIAYRQEIALLLSASVALVVALSLGQGLIEFVIYVATAAAAIQLLDRIRTRTKLIYVGFCAGIVAAFTTAGVTTVASQAFGTSILTSFPGGADAFWQSPAWALLNNVLWSGFCALLAGVLMTGMLPFVEKLFDVQTDISLLELGDAAHPLLQELVRRAPGTYNHSINVASIGEAAADSIGANGLLVRVGAYFHDIGKMLKPSYFVENQGQSGNRHESLVPAMSTLVIIAHVKDGADLARQNHLPQSIIDFIEQHHGTTLVQYFYNQATEQSQSDPDGAKIDERSFRYPGPRPQTREAGVMMLADATESASRALVDPAPARIENLVHEIAMARLLDGQFDECGLTLKELSTVEDSLVKSLSAVYHGRVKYPEKQHTA